MFMEEQINPNSFYWDYHLFKNIDSNYLNRKSPDKNLFLIDYGTYATRAGIYPSNEPQLICKSLTVKTRRNNQNISVSGNQITPDFNKIQKKKIFENLEQFDVKSFEEFNDYIFTELHVQKGDSLIYTEPIGVNEKFRKQLFELYFECYELEKVLPCVDCISSSFKLLNEYKTNNALIISIGYNKTLTLPFINGTLDKTRVRQINIGVHQMKHTMMKFFDLKYNSFHQQLTRHYHQGFFEKEAFFARNYKNQQKFYYETEYLQQNQSNFYEQLTQEEQQELFMPKYVKIFQEDKKSELTQEQIDKNKQINRERAQKILLKREQNRKIKKEKQLEELNFFKQLLCDGNEKGFEKIKEEALKIDCESLKDIKKKIRKIEIKLKIISSQQLEQERLKLLQKPIEDLNKEEIKKRRLYLMLQKTQQARIIKREQQQKQKQELEQMMNDKPELYYNELFKKREKLKKKIKKIKLYKEDSKLKRQKEQQKTQNQKNDQDEEDEIQNEQLREFYIDMLELSSDPEIYQKKLHEVENNIKEIEPDFNPDFDNPEVILINSYMNSPKIYIGQDIIRSTETLFKPYFIGLNQKGLTESLYYSLKTLENSHLQNVLDNVFIIGGGSTIKGIKERLENELLQNLSFKEINNVNVNIVKNYQDLPYQGMKMFYELTDKKSQKNWFYTKKEYEEYGPNYLKVSPIGNSQLIIKIQKINVKNYYQLNNLQ